MGAWGAGSFENDMALDWADAVQGLDDVRKTFERLKAETDAHPDKGAMYLDADFASELIAAAETVAMLLGREIPNFPKELKARIGDKIPESDPLFHQARNAISHVMRTSELAELWEEAAEETDDNSWLAELSELIDRLNPDIEYIPPPIEELEADIGGPIENCAFCNKQVSEKDEIFTIAIKNHDSFSSMTRYMPIHLKCLNARLHHKFAIQNFKFDPDNPPDLDDL